MNRKEWLINNSSKIGPDAYYKLNDSLNSMTDEEFELIEEVKLKNPTITLILSIFFGMFGFDRFYLGGVEGIVTGLIKMVTSGGLFIWALIDIFTAKTRTVKQNSSEILQILELLSLSDDYDINNKSYNKEITQAGIELAKGLKNIATDINNNSQAYIGRR